MTPQEIDHVADSGKKVEQTDESAQNVQNGDLIQRKVAIEAVDTIGHIATTADGDKCIRGSAVKYVLSMLPSAQNTSSSCAHENDLISRQAAIEAMGKAKWAKERLEELPSAQPEVLAHGEGELIAQPEPHWIPCSERLPEENGQYLITVRYKHVDEYEDVYAEHGDWCDGNWDMFCFGHCGEVESILAWMPLPEPYRGGDA